MYIMYIHNYMLHISADFFQSKSVPAYIVIHQYLAILRFSRHQIIAIPYNILQIAIYLHCKGAGTFLSTILQGAQAAPTFCPGWPQILFNSMKTYASQSKQLPYAPVCIHMEPYAAICTKHA